MKMTAACRENVRLLSTARLVESQSVGRVNASEKEGKIG